MPFSAACNVAPIILEEWYEEYGVAIFDEALCCKSKRVIRPSYTMARRQKMYGGGSTSDTTPCCLTKDSSRRSDLGEGYDQSVVRL